MKVEAEGVHSSSRSVNFASGSRHPGSIASLLYNDAPTVTGNKDVGTRSQSRRRSSIASALFYFAKDNTRGRRSDLSGDSKDREDSGVDNKSRRRSSITSLLIYAASYGPTRATKKCTNFDVVRAFDEKE